MYQTFNYNMEAFVFYVTKRKCEIAPVEELLKNTTLM